MVRTREKDFPALLETAWALNPLAGKNAPRRARALVRQAGVRPGGLVFLAPTGAGLLPLAFLAAGARVAATDPDPLARFVTRALCQPVSLPALVRAAAEVLEEAGVDKPPDLFPPPHAPERLRRALETRPPGPDRDMLALVLFRAAADAVSAPISPRPGVPLAEASLKPAFEKALEAALEFTREKNRLLAFVPLADRPHDLDGPGLCLPAGGMDDIAGAMEPEVVVACLASPEEPGEALRRFMEPLVPGAETGRPAEAENPLNRLFPLKEAWPQARWLALAAQGRRDRAL
ncbi:MAG: hypothetical protein JRI97_12755, partial [Deltaproteobacteria bacterium]|nr:hypothetical protein [Deltaproteobacteria bacterium]